MRIRNDGVPDVAGDDLDYVGSNAPWVWYGSRTLDGTAEPWASAPLFSTYIHTTAGYYTKVASAGATADWRSGSTAAIKPVYLSYSSATTVAISAGATGLGNLATATSVTFSNLDTGSEAAGTNYYVYAVLAASGLAFVISASASAPTGYSDYELVGWFHNDPSKDISQYSVASGDDTSHPRRGPMPGMVMHPSGFMVDIYIASDSGGTGLALTTGNAATSAYNATPWVSINQIDAMRACTNAGKRLCTNEEWSLAALGTPAGADNNDTCWTASGNTGSHPTGTLPNCKSALGVYDMTGNVWEWVSTWYAETDVYTDQTGWDWASAWTNEPEGGSAYTPFGTATGPDSLPGPRAWARGGNWSNSTNAGGWAADGNFSPRRAASSIGLRCCA